MKMKFQSLVILFGISLVVTLGGCSPLREPPSSSTITATPEIPGLVGRILVEPPEVVEPNPGPFIGLGNLAGANAEAAEVLNTAKTYLADNRGGFDFTSENLVPGYLNKPIKAKYYFSSTTGLITRVDSMAGGWTGIVFSLTGQKWIKGVPDEDHASDQDVF